jgi:hypothetical protein
MVRHCENEVCPFETVVFEAIPRVVLSPSRLAAKAVAQPLACKNLDHWQARSLTFDDRELSVCPPIRNLEPEVYSAALHIAVPLLS